MVAALPQHPTSAHSRACYSIKHKRRTATLMRLHVEESHTRLLMWQPESSAGCRLVSQGSCFEL